MLIPPIDTKAVAFHAGMDEYARNWVKVFVCAACGTATVEDSPHYCSKCHRPVCLGCAMCATECEHRTRKGIFQPPRLGRKKTEQLDKLLDKLISERNKLC
ncbi:hypothetical protein ESN35_06715 [Bifidobacterium pullorum subsp. gallinarum]|uniref:Uncharacterized protein n=1 Tax=Bifidobacterium pullorum subsp. gallinarum TaxID=78344 RepID=A0A4P6DYY6_9BIFI|nr:hypothetical protein [Bifidobacterium pullorum]QAY33128.1 hypothetical protein ESN35_06715 [Bifidobacterium pullorum subsp. gallinarum]